MLASINDVNAMLEEWEQIKYVSTHISPTDDTNILAYMQAKSQLMHYSQQLRWARLVNDANIEKEYTIKFTDAYTTFIKDFVFKVLKNDRSAQP